MESEIELMNNSLQTPVSSTNVTPSHHDRFIKKRRVSISNTQKFSSSLDSEFLKTSMLTNVYRTPMFLQTFSLAVRVILFSYKFFFKMIQNYTFIYSYWTFAHWISNIHSFQRMYWLQRLFLLVNQIGQLNRLLVSCSIVYLIFLKKSPTT